MIVACIRTKAVEMVRIGKILNFLKADPSKLANRLDN